MMIALVFLALLMFGFVGWLLSQSVNVQPWVAGPAPPEPTRAEPPAFTAGRVGLGVFLAVVTSVFALCLSAYSMRMHLAEGWRPLTEPALLWVNSAILIAASIALQGAWNAARHDDPQRLRRMLVAGAALTLGFIVGQYGAWQVLVAEEQSLTSGPAAAFFYLLTALHALHLVGGLGALARPIVQTWRGALPRTVRPAVELCAIYWHFLLLVWVVLFTMLLRT